MNPETPQSPQPVSPPAVAPLAAPVMAPAPTLDVSQTSKTGKTALIMAIASLVVFVIGFLFGYAALLGAALGSYAINLGRKSGKKSAVTIGGIGLAINGIWFLLVLLSHK